MNLNNIFIFILFCHFTIQNDFIINQSSARETFILSEVITNYLTKYFSNEQIFLSIVIPPSENLQNFESDFFLKLFDNLPKFEHNILDKLDTSIHQRHAFNLIMVDDCETFV